MGNTSRAPSAASPQKIQVNAKAKTKNPSGKALAIVAAWNGFAIVDISISPFPYENLLYARLYVFAGFAASRSFHPPQGFVQPYVWCR